jgi:hypothetical protein
MSAPFSDWVPASKKRRKRWIFYTAWFSFYHAVLMSIVLGRASVGKQRFNPGKGFLWVI